MPVKKTIGTNAGGPRWFPKRTRWDTSVALFRRSAQYPVMRASRAPKRIGGFSNPPELLIIVVVLSMISALVLPVAIKRHLGILPTIGIILGGFGMFVLWLQHRNIIDWFRGRRWRDRKDR